MLKRFFSPQAGEPKPKTSRWPTTAEGDPHLAETFTLLRDKWREVPFDCDGRILPSDFLQVSDAELVHRWEAAAKSQADDHRWWYQTLYKDSFRGKRLIDYGCGLAYDTLMYARNGTQVTFVDLSETTLKVVQRLAGIFRVQNAEFLYLEDLRSLEALHGDYDVVYCCGSMMNAPLWVLAKEAQAILPRVPKGGRWMEFSYPKARWERDGSPAFEDWGAFTDGGAPWVEWHDSAKVKSYLAPAEFDVVLEVDFHGQDFNWIDLIRR
jgi:SAM-dependent methyltransferase